MIEFLDQNGLALEVGDEIEYWSSSYKDWLKAKISGIEAIRKGDYVSDGVGGYKTVPVTKKKIKVYKWDEHLNRYKHYDLLNLRRSEVIRKVV